MTSPLVEPGLVLKVTPPKLRKSLLARTRLRRESESGGDEAVTLVEAPAGHGKTSLLAQWRLDWLQAGAVVAWLGMDAEDSAAATVAGIVESLRRATGRAALGLNAIEAVRRGSGTAAALTALLAEIADSAAQTILIFDDCERVTDPAVIEIFDYLLQNLPPNLRIVAASRTRMPLHTADLLAHGDLRRVTAAELRFDLGETIRWLSGRLGNRVDADMCARLHELTEGWPLGLQLAAASLERADDVAHALEMFSTSRDDALRQLLSGMVAALPPPLRRFATQCALLDALHPLLCEAVTGEKDAAAALQRLLAETPLVTAAENSDWLHLHPLAREYLRTWAEIEMSAAERRELHVRAWHWLAAHGFPEQAAQHALAAGRQKEAFSLIAGCLYDKLLQGHVGLVREWLAKLPPREIARNPRLQLMSAAVRAQGFPPQELAPFAASLCADPAVDPELREMAGAVLALACAAADDLDGAKRYDAAYAHMAADGPAAQLAPSAHTALIAYVAIHEGATEEARRNQTGIPEGGVFNPSKVFGDYHIGTSYLWEGRPVLAEPVLRVRHAMCESLTGRRGQWTAMLGGVLAAACWEGDARDEARALLAYRLDVMENGAMPEGICYAYLTLARMAAADGDEARAFALLESLAGIGATRGLPRLKVMSLVERIRLHAARQRPGQCGVLLAQMESLFEGPVPASALLMPLLRLQLAMAKAYAAVAAGADGDAAAHLATAWTLARQINRGRETVQILALRALLAERSGEDPGAPLTEALSLAEAGGMVRVFADTLPEVVEVIRRRAGTGADTPVTRAYLERVLAAASAPAAAADTPAPAAGSAILTPKESEVLQLARGRDGEQAHRHDARPQPRNDQVAHEEALREAQCRQSPARRRSRADAGAAGLSRGLRTSLGPLPERGSRHPSQHPRGHRDFGAAAPADGAAGRFRQPPDPTRRPPRWGIAPCAARA